MLPDRGSSKHRSSSVLFLAQLPPPYHGQSAVAASLHDILIDQPRVEIQHLWRGGAQSNQDVGQRSLGKYVGFVWLVIELVGVWLSGRRFDFAYLGLAPWAHTVSRDALLAWLSKRIARRVLLHVHGDGIADLFRAQGMRGMMYREGFGGCELLAMTGKTADEAQAAGIFVNTIEMPNAAADPGEPDRAPASPELRIGCLGNLDARKGVFDFVDVVGELKRRGIALQATIVGRPSPSLSVETLRKHVAHLGLTDDINVTGGVTEDVKDAILSEQDVFLYLSRHDLAPLAVIEALAHGTAPLVVDTGGLREMVGPKLAGNVVPSEWPREEAVAYAADVIAGYAHDTSLLKRDQGYARARYVDNYRPDLFRARVLAILSEDGPQAGGASITRDVLAEVPR